MSEQTNILTKAPSGFFGQQAQPDPHPRILAVHSNSSVLRDIREATAGIPGLEIDTTPSPEFAFEMAMSRRHKLILIDYALPNIGGELFYHFVSVAYPKVHPQADSAPGVVYLCEKEERTKARELASDARVKAILARPYDLDKFSELALAIIPPDDRLPRKI